MKNSTKEQRFDFIESETETKSRHRRTNCCYDLGYKVPARLVLYFLSWSGFLVSFMMRNDMNFAVTAMVPKYDLKDVSLGSSNDSSSLLLSSHSNGTQNIQADASWRGENGNLSGAAQISPGVNHEDIYDWSDMVVSLIQSSFYWWYVLSQVVGGVATEMFGTKQVFGWSQFITAVCSLSMPFAADIHYSAVIFLRSVQGFASGLTWPAMYALVGCWIPLVERSRFMSSFQGFSIGIGITYFLCGIIIHYLGWRAIFYTTGSLGILWCLFWYLYAFNKPRDHPRISDYELCYIEHNVSAEIKHSDKKGERKELQVPWASIFGSLPAWSIAITTFGRIWMHYVFIVLGPQYMQKILHFDYKENGFISGLPFICSYFSSLLFCYIADKLVQRHCLTLTQVRKLFTALSQLVPAILTFWVGYIDIQHVGLIIGCWYLSVIFITASYAGAMACIVDIAPNFAGPVLAVCQTIHMSASFLSPLSAGIIPFADSQIEKWRIMFGLAGAISIGTYLVFQIFGTAEIQPWNHIPTDNDQPLASSPVEDHQCDEIRQQQSEYGEDKETTDDYKRDKLLSNGVSTTPS